MSDYLESLGNKSPTPTISIDIRVGRMQLVEACVRAGVELSKAHFFGKLMPRVSVVSPTNMAQYIKPLLDLEEQRLLEDIKDTNVSIALDGTPREGDAFCMVIRYEKDFETTERVLDFRTLQDHMDHDALISLVAQVISDHAIKVGNVVAFMHDRVSVNTCAMKTLSVFYSKAVDMNCTAHTLDNAGKRFFYPNFQVFMQTLQSLFSHSEHVKTQWLKLTGSKMKTNSRTRWWSFFEQACYIHSNWSFVEAFIDSLDGDESTTRSQLKAMKADANKWMNIQLELATLVDAARLLVLATYKLEGDGCVVFRAYEMLARIHTFIGMETSADKFPNLFTLRDDLQANELLVRSVCQKAFKYFMDQFFPVPGKTTDLTAAMKVFKAARLMLPQYVNTLDKVDVSLLRDAFPKVVDDAMLVRLRSELPTYLSAAKDISVLPSDDETPVEDQVVLWWKEHSGEFGTWKQLFRRFMLIQPTSASVERVFSHLKRQFDDRRTARDDLIKLGLMYCMPR